MAELKKFHAIIALGVILEGETAHARLIADAVTRSLLDISLAHRVPVIHEVLLVRDKIQAEERCMHAHNNRGTEAARAAAMAARQLAAIA
jgi:6,7-dimethyl-8-ribityllumazine synthase